MRKRYLEPVIASVLPCKMVFNTPFDCRVQRYFVEGIFQTMEDRGFGGFTAWVEELIPRGADRCHFVVERRTESGGKNPWHSYSEELGKRALKKMEQDGKSSGDRAPSR